MRHRLFFVCVMGLVVTGLRAAAARAQAVAPGEGTPLAAVDASIGGDHGGNAFVGACAPFGLVKLGPDVDKPQQPNGYRSDRPLTGFAHTHVSGTGGAGRGGNFLTLPMLGPLSLDLFKTGFAKQDEVVRPGYYAVSTPTGIRAELTASARCGYHRYTFPASDQAIIAINVSASRGNANHFGSDVCLDAAASVVGDRRIEGWMISQGGWGHAIPHTVYFSAVFSKPFTTARVWRDGQPAEAGVTTTDGTDCGIAVSFPTREHEQITMRLGVAYTSLENARRHLAQTDGQSFDQVWAATQALWSDYLGKIDLQGATPAQRELFYSALYRTALMPTDVTGDNPRWTGPAPHYWDYYAIWDTVRCTNSLYTLVQPQRQRAMLQCLLDIYQHDGWLPDAWIAGHYAIIQGGTNADLLLADAAVKQLGGIDLNLAYEAAYKDASDPASDEPFRHGRYRDYFRIGYLTPRTTADSNKPGVPVSRTLEYAANDFAVSELARLTGHAEEAARLRARSISSGFVLFNPQSKFFEGRDAAGNFVAQDDPTVEVKSGFRLYYEGSPWHYAFSTPQDMAGLIQRHGGEAQFAQFLDTFFAQNLYNPGNEPDILVPWLYPYVHQPAKSADIVRQLMAKHYHPGPGGLPGNDDAGTLSTWYIFAALGFYPNVGQDVYLIAAPTFPQAVLHLEHDQTLTITARHLSDANRYVQSATLNGQPLDQAWFRHTAIKDGGTLVFEMGPEPSAWGTTGPLPPSASDE